jgi:hypothetical protein
MHMFPYYFALPQFLSKCLGGAGAHVRCEAIFEQDLRVLLLRFCRACMESCLTVLGLGKGTAGHAICNAQVSNFLVLPHFLYECLGGAGAHVRCEAMFKQHSCVCSLLFCRSCMGSCLTVLGLGKGTASRARARNR